MALPRVEVPPLQSEDRLLNQFNQQQRLANTNVFKRLETLETPQALVMPTDEHTRFWWPGNETDARWNNAIPGVPLTPLIARVPGFSVAHTGGLVYPYCIRVVETTPLANRGVTGVIDVGGMPSRGVTLSAWVRPGGDTSTTGFLLGVYRTGVAHVLTMVVRADGLVTVNAGLVSGGVVSLSTTGDSFCTPHEWNHIAVVFRTDNELVVFVNGCGNSNSYPSGGGINWAPGGTIEFDIGAPGVATFGGGLAQDIRLETVARPLDYLANAWRRGKQLPVY